ncbi:MAG: MFS transporter, partial [Pseudomonadota bacterium]
HLRDAISNRTLLWLMLLSVMMYAFGHVPFIFGQPIILETLKPLGVGEVAPFVSGVVSAAMMALSVAMSWFAMRLRKALGLTAILIFAFGLQIGLVGVMGFGEGVIVIAFLLLRKVPDSFAKPFITATMQPLLNDEGRATYLSLASLLSRLALGGSLWAASFGASSRSTMSAEEIQMTLTAYFVAGVAALALFTLTRGALNVRK